MKQEFNFQLREMGKKWCSWSRYGKQEEKTALKETTQIDQTGYSTKSQEQYFI